MAVRFILIYLLGFLSLVISLPFSSLPVAIGLYSLWSFGRFLPVYGFGTLEIRKLAKAAKPEATTSECSRLNKLLHLFAVGVCQFFYYRLYPKLLGAVARREDAAALMWFTHSDWNLVLRSPDEIVEVITDWLLANGAPASSFLILPPTIAFLGFTLISIPAVLARRSNASAFRRIRRNRSC